MKKFVFILFIISIGIMFKKDNYFIIPNEAIRFRIIANSNNIEDQIKKVEIKEELELELQRILNEASNYKEAINLLKNNLGYIENIVKNKTLDYNINLGLNYFPQKNYKNVTYPEGNYNSLVITLGKGLGNNWWCVLYPPLCFIDEKNISSTEYKFFIKDIFNKLK